MEEINSLDWEEPIDNAQIKKSTQDVVKEAKNRQKRYEQSTEQRLFLAKWVVWTSSIWLGMVLIILILVGATILYLSPSVLNVLLTTTTANVLGLAYIVLKGLFGKLILSLIFKIFRFRRQYRMSLHLTESANHYTHCLDSSQIHIFSKIFSQY